MTAATTKSRIEKSSQAIRSNWTGRDTDWTGPRTANPHRRVIRSAVRLIRALTA
jgi:hypothetical protein